MRRLNIVGERYGRLAVTEFSHVQSGNSYWKCLCDCGNICVKSANTMRISSTLSCGCSKALKYSPGETGLKILYNRYKINANNRNIGFDLTIEEFKDITSKECFYCGEKPNFFSGEPAITKTMRNHTLYRYNGIDRVDSSRGYEKNNIVPCCKWCNLAKGNKKVEEFKEHIFKMYNFMKLR